MGGRSAVCIVRIYAACDGVVTEQVCATLEFQ